MLTMTAIVDRISITPSVKHSGIVVTKDVPVPHVSGMSALDSGGHIRVCAVLAS